MKDLPIGRHDFRMLRQEDLLYVDKTEVIGPPAARRQAVVFLTPAQVWQIAHAHHLGGHFFGGKRVVQRALHRRQDHLGKAHGVAVFVRPNKFKASQRKRNVDAPNSGNCS